MEKDDDWYGEGNEYHTEFRQLDVRVGRWMSLDPMMAVVPDRSPYEFVFNNPVSLTDPSGLFPGFGKGKKGGGDIPTRTPRYRHEDSGGSGAGASSGPSAIGGMLRSVGDFVVSAAKFVGRNSDAIVTASNTLNELSRRSTLPNDFSRYDGGSGYGLSGPPTGNGYKPEGFLGLLSSLNEPPKRSDYPDGWFGNLLFEWAKWDYLMLFSPGGFLKVIGPGGKAISTTAKGISKFADYNSARNAALKWLTDRGFKAEKVVLGKFGTSKGKPIGMSSMDGTIGFRIEYDARSGAHINVWFGKEKGPHFQFDASEETVNEIIKRFSR